MRRVGITIILGIWSVMWLFNFVCLARAFGRDADGDRINSLWVTG